MPEDDLDKTTAADSKLIAEHMNDALYSPDAQARNNPPRKDLARLTFDQFRTSVMDLLSHFRLGPGFDRPNEKNRNLLRSF
jgi:hypothetical protein